MHAAQKRETRQTYVDAQAVKTSFIAAEIVRNHTGPHISSCAKLSILLIHKINCQKAHCVHRTLLPEYCDHGYITFSTN